MNVTTLSPTKYLLRHTIERLVGMDSKELELYSTYEGQNGFIFKLGIQAMDGEVLGFDRLLSAGAKGMPNWGVELTKIFESPYLKAQTRY